MCASHRQPQRLPQFFPRRAFPGRVVVRPASHTAGRQVPEEQMSTVQERVTVAETSLARTGLLQRVSHWSWTPNTCMPGQAGPNVHSMVMRLAGDLILADRHSKKYRTTQMPASIGRLGRVRARTLLEHVPTSLANSAGHRCHFRGKVVHGATKPRKQAPYNP